MLLFRLLYLSHTHTTTTTTPPPTAVLDKSRCIYLKSLSNETKRKIVIPNVFINRIYPAGIGRLLLRANDCIILYDIQSLRVVAEVSRNTCLHMCLHMSLWLPLIFTYSPASTSITRSTFSVSLTTSHYHPLLSLHPSCARHRGTRSNTCGGRPTASTARSSARPTSS
jgi:hypothetical protein